MERRIKLGELLIRAGLITELQLKAALAEQQQWGSRLGQILVKMNFISEDILVKGLSKLTKLPIADLQDFSVPAAVLERFDPTDCQARAYLPLRYNPADKSLLVAFADVNDLALIDELRYRHALTIRPLVAGENSLQAAIRNLFYGEAFDASVRGDEPGLKLVNNQGGTLIKTREQILRESQQVSPSSPLRTGVERAPQGLPATFAAMASEPALPPPPVASPAVPSPPPSRQIFEQLEQGQKRQAQAVRTLLELLISRGIFTREEFLQATNSNPKR